VGAEKIRLKKEIEGLQKAITSKERQLGDETFPAAPRKKIINGWKLHSAEQLIELRKCKMVCRR